MPSERIAIFIDAGYLEKILQHEFNKAQIDFGKFANELSSGETLLRTYYYNCPPFQSNPPTTDEARRKAASDRFYASLNRLPRFEVRLGRLAKRHCKSCHAQSYQQKRADLMLGVDLASLGAKGQITKAILVTGDSDFLPAIASAKSSGVLIHLYHGGIKCPPHKDLFDECDERTTITQALIDKIPRA